jgi:uncharacterized protein YndB with AHSA1/START domain
VIIVVIVVIDVWTPSRPRTGRAHFGLAAVSTPARHDGHGRHERSQTMGHFLYCYRSPVEYRPRDPDLPAKWSAWFAGLGDQLVDRGNPVFTSTTVGGSTSASAALGGWSVVEATDLETAARLAEDCPGIADGFTVEVGAVTLLDAQHRQWLADHTPAAIRHQVGIKASIDTVYDAFATVDGLRTFWTKGADGDPRPGGTMRFFFDREEPSAVMQVIEATPASRVEWRCVAGPDEWLGSTITFELSSNDDETVVLFTHAWRAASVFQAHCSTKWASLLLSLKAFLEGGRPGAYPDDVRIISWER